MKMYRCRHCGSAVTHKLCTRCLQELPVSAFPPNGRSGNVRSECRACNAIRMRIQRLKRTHSGAPKPDALLEYTEKEVGVYRGGTWRPRREDAA